jgi:hypothetical protein
MTVFSVSKGLVKQSNQILINSNKLSSVFYNIGKKFILTDSQDLSIAKELLERNFINVKIL